MADRKSIAQEYYVLAVDQKGRRPNDDIGFSAGLVIAGVTDLMASNAVTLAEDRLRVTARLPEELRHLCSLYDYLQEGPNGTTAVYDYLDGKKRKLLIRDIGSSLADEGLAKACRCGLFGRNILYVPEPSYRETLIGLVKEALFQEQRKARDYVMLMLLSEAGVLKRYFPKDQRKVIKAAIKRLEEEDRQEPWARLAARIDRMTVLALRRLWKECD